MMINRKNSNISFNGKLNVFTINPNTGYIQTTMVDSSSIKAIKSSMQNGEQINSLIYRTPKGVKKFFSSQFYKDYEKAMEKRRYWAEQINRKQS